MNVRAASTAAMSEYEASVGSSARSDRRAEERPYEAVGDKDVGLGTKDRC